MTQPEVIMPKNHIPGQRVIPLGVMPDGTAGPTSIGSSGGSTTEPGGATPYANPTADNTPTTISGDAPGKLWAVSVLNPTTDQLFLHLYDALEANVVVGTTAVVLTLSVPPGGGSVIGERSEEFSMGLKFDTGMTYSLTTQYDGADGAPIDPCPVFAQYTA